MRGVIHFHGGPITPDPVALRAWKGRHAFISFAHPEQLAFAATIVQSFALDNGAFSFWKAGKIVNWPLFYAWVAKWRRHPRFAFAVVPDVIEGTEAENDALLEGWPFSRHEGAAVWHTNESIERLKRLAAAWPLVAIGSSGEHDVRRPEAFLKRMAEVMPHICDAEGYPVCKLHGLRQLNPKIFSKLPLSSGDSTNVARNTSLDTRWKGTYAPTTKETRAQILVERIEHFNSACRYDMPAVDIFG